MDLPIHVSLAEDTVGPVAQQNNSKVTMGIVGSPSIQHQSDFSLVGWLARSVSCYVLCTYSYREITRVVEDTVGTSSTTKQRQNDHGGHGGPLCLLDQMCTNHQSDFSDHSDQRGLGV